MTHLGNLSPEGSIAVGVIVCLLSSGIQSYGLTLQRKSHMIEETRYFDSPRPPYKRRRWQVGFSLFLIANLVGSTIQLSILPLPVLAALQAAGLVFNSINATWILGEPFTRWSLAGTVLVSGGALLIAYFGALPEPAHTLSQLLALFARKVFIAWAVCQVLLIFAIFGLIYLLRRLSPSKGQSKRMRLSRGMCYGALSGALSAHSLLMAKSAVELVVRTLADGENQFARWQAWLILIALVIIGLSQLYCLHAGLQLCSTSILYPFVFCIYNVVTILDGLIYFNQGSQLSGMASGLIVLGTLVLLSGVFCLSWRLADEEGKGPQVPEISENPLSPPIGIIGVPGSPYDARRGGEREPLLARSPQEQYPPSPISFRPRRAPTGTAAVDEEADIGFDVERGRISAIENAANGSSRNIKAKTRKRATFASFEAVDSATQRTRALTNPISDSRRRPSLVSLYTRTRNRRVSMADNRALWGELEEATSPVSRGGLMARSEIIGTGSRPRVTSSVKGLRRMSEGSSQLLENFGARQSSFQGGRRASDAGSSSRKTSAGSGVKHGDPGQAVTDEVDDPMTASMPLMQRTDTGRTYRVVSTEARRRRLSVPEGERPSSDSRRAVWHENADVGMSWHTIDSSRGRPSDSEESDRDGHKMLVDRTSRRWEVWRDWFLRRGPSDRDENG